ncbi:DNA replication protein DnaC [Lipingzhangella halophila]|uniref:DNA replication protein DnaC n=1 Tax=Lipingzhangella halophila TaxID=1783352 RepID=A0A7W7RI00_9ACTN|nr:ATP-binding protein [Lipingzhangella halophila]MBB4931811.1 DNA replication protein DnaC [Lipingzhangella halophila]
MTDFDPYDDAANLRAAQESVLRERAEHRTNLFLSKRPAKFAKEGELHPAVRDWCRDVYRGHAASLILVGGIGTGKTWSTWKAVETLVRAGWDGHYDIVDAYDVKDAMRDRDKEAIATWREADVLAIDDIGAIGMHDWDSDNLHKLVNERWKHDRPTVITSNAHELKPLLGELVASRLVDGATFVALSGTDRRRSQ